MSKCHETNATKNTKKIPTDIPKNTQQKKRSVMSGVLLNCLEATLGDYYRLTLVCLTRVVVVVAASSAYAVRVAGTQGAMEERAGAASIMKSACALFF